MTDPDVHPLLEPLVRDWLSSRHGFISCSIRESQQSNALQIWKGGITNPRSAFLGCVSLIPGKSLPRIVFEQQGGTSCRLIPLASRRKRVVWQSQEQLDIWDGELLDTIFEAAKVVKCRYNIDPYMDRCLPQLSSQELVDSPLTVGLCTATMNRLWQLKYALPLTLLHCWAHRRYTKIYLVDFGSTDGTLDWILNRCHAAIDCDLLRVYSCREKFWHASIAKNAAHRVASEDIVVNVDGDNIVGPDFPLNVVQNFQQHHTVVQYEWGEGTCGRIACLRKDFLDLGGYDEDSFPMGSQDTDLVRRLEQLPKAWKKRVKQVIFSQAIPNTVDEKIRNCDPSAIGKLRWGQMDVQNRDTFKERRAAGQLARNQDKEIGIPARSVSKPPRVLEQTHV